MIERLRGLAASALVAVAIIIVLWWVLRSLFGWVLWLVNVTVLVAVVLALLAAARRLRKPRGPRF